LGLRVVGRTPFLDASQHLEVVFHVRYESREKEGGREEERRGQGVVRTERTRDRERERERERDARRWSVCLGFVDWGAGRVWG
jgi:hypothetical protein